MGTNHHYSTPAPTLLKSYRAPLSQMTEAATTYFMSPDTITSLISAWITIMCSISVVLFDYKILLLELAFAVTLLWIWKQNPTELRGPWRTTALVYGLIKFVFVVICISRNVINIHYLNEVGTQIREERGFDNASTMSFVDGARNFIQYKNSDLSAKMNDTTMILDHFRVNRLRQELDAVEADWTNEEIAV